jgi:hypothetical protein
MYVIYNFSIRLWCLSLPRIYNLASFFTGRVENYRGGAFTVLHPNPEILGIISKYLTEKNTLPYCSEVYVTQNKVFITMALLTNFQSLGTVRSLHICRVSQFKLQSNLKYFPRPVSYLPLSI